MARNRIIKPEFFTSEKLSSISELSNLFFIGILIHCDDYGVCINNNRRLIGDIFPLRESITEKDIEKAKQELLKIRVLVAVEKDEKKYLIVKNWKEHQKVEKPSKRRFLNDDEIDGFLKTLPDTLPETLPDTVEKFSETLPAPILINNGSVNGSVNGIMSDKPTNSPTKKFIPPTLQECIDYFIEKGKAGMDGEKFFYHWDGLNWFKGKTKIVKWKSAAATWILNDFANKNKTKEKPKYEYEVNDNDYNF